MHSTPGTREETTMAVRVGINGFGRIGRSFERVLLDRAPPVGIEVVAVNEPNADAETLAFLLEHDSVAGVARRSTSKRPTETAGRRPGDRRHRAPANPPRSRGPTTTSTS